ncbi:MAG TPA: hypothetical protein VGF17_12545 [Phytomonospora sp.]
MGFPDDPLGLRGELLLGSTWTDITGDLYARDPITHTRGRAYRATATDPATCSATIRNVDGRYTPRNPQGPYFGLLSRNTPLRISLPGGVTHLATNGGAADRARTPDSAPISLTGDLDVRVDLFLAQWSSSDTVEVAGKYGAAGARGWLLFLYQGRAWFYWSSDGSNELMSSSSAKLPIPASGRMTLRATLDVNNGASGRTITYYTGPSVDGPWTPVGDPVVQAGTTAVFDTPEPLDVGAVNKITFGNPVGRYYRFQLRKGINGAPVADVDFTAQTPGAAAFTDRTGLAWTVDGNASITDRVIRFSGEVPEWPPKWTASKADAWTPVEAAGPLRRLSQGQKALDSTLRHRIPSGRPVAYWPLEDGRDATQFASPLPGVRPMSMSGMDAAAVDTLDGSEALPVVRSNATFSGTVPMTPATILAAEWHTEFVFFAASPPTTAHTLLMWTGTGTVKLWRLMIDSGGVRIFGYDDDGNTVTSSLLALSSLGVFNAWTRWRLWAKQNGSAVDWSVQFVPIGGSGTGVVTTSYTGRVGRITGVKSNDSGVPDSLDGVALGHISVFTTAGIDIYSGADLGFTGERAGARMRRLADEQAVPLSVIGDPADTEPVGPQRPAALLDLLRLAAETDGGIFGEASDRAELTYRTRASLYNQPPALVLDYAAGQVAPPFEPVEDDQIRNDWTITRDGGSSGHAVLDEGPLSVQAPPNGIGPYPDGKTLSLYRDEQTDPLASWMLHLTSWDEARYPSVTLLLHKCPELIPDVLALRVGDKIRIVNLPVEFAAAGTVELLVDGWTETLQPRAWAITFTCSPAGPWTVAVRDETTLARRDAVGSTLAAAASATATTLSVATTDLPWTTDPADMPLNITVGGEEMTVSAITGTTSPQKFTIAARSVNGVTKPQTAGTAVHVAQPATRAL